MKTTITRAWVRETPHPATGYRSYDVIVNIDGPTGSYIESIHDTKDNADDQAKRVAGQTVNFLDLVRTH